MCKYVEKIQEIIRQRKPALLIAAANSPTTISAKLEGIDLLEIDSAVNQSSYLYPIRTLDGFPNPVDLFQEYRHRRAEEFKPQTTLTAFCDIPEFHPLGGLSVEQAFVGPLLANVISAAEVDRSFLQATDNSLPVVVVRVPEDNPFTDSLIATAAELPCRWLVQMESGKSVSPLPNLRSFTGPLSGDLLRRTDFFVGNGSHGNVYRLSLGDLHEAEACQLQALILNQELGNKRGEAHTRGLLASLYVQRGEEDRAESMACQALSLFRVLDMPASAAAQQALLGSLCGRRGNLHQAEQHLRQSVDLYAGIGDQKGMAFSKMRLGHAYQEAGRRIDAELMWRGARSLFIELQMDSQIEEVDKLLRYLR